MRLNVAVIIVARSRRQDTRTFTISNLIEGTNYLVRVQALSKSGSGRVASIQFTTPLLQLTPLGE